MAFLRKGFGLLLIAITFLILKFSSPTFIDNFYSNGIFFSIRNAFNQVVGVFDFPVSFFFLFLSISFLVYLIFIFIKRNGKRNSIFFKTINFLAILFFVFYLVWGFNYNRPTLESKLLSPNDSLITTNELKSEISIIAHKAIFLRRKINPDSLPFNISISDKEIGGIVKNTLSLSIPRMEKIIAKTPIRHLPDGLLMNCGIVGQYFPFTGEANFDVGMHDIRKPVVIAHELFHALGHCLESDCDFLAYHYMKTSKSEYVRYSAEMEYLRYLLGDLKQRDSTAFNALWPTIIPSALKMDFDAIKENRLKYEGFFSVLGDEVNNLFLKFQGVKEGVKSYDKLVPMVNKWKVVGKEEKLENLIFNPK
jgi:hypothetical protein